MLPLHNQRRAERAARTIQSYGTDINDSNLIDLLTDAMHWCDHTGEDFHRILAQAGRHYLTELVELPTTRQAIEAIEPVNVHNLLAERQQIALIWGLDDVLQQRPDLTSDQAWQVLERCERAHDCNYGMTWDFIDAVAEGLYPTPDHSLTPPAES